MSAQKDSSKKILDEEEYTEALDIIIERDFYPDLSKLKRQAKWLDAKEKNDFHFLGELRRRTDSQDCRLEEKDCVSHSNDDEKCNYGLSIYCKEMSYPDETAKSATISTEEANLSGLSLNSFVARHTSEDNASFAGLLKKSQEEHRQKYHWAYSDILQKGDPKLHLLADGTYMSKERRLLADTACEITNGLKDSRPSAPDSWNFRPRNALLFPPDIAVTREICKVQPQHEVKLLAGPSTLSIRTGRAPRVPKLTKYENTRFKNSFIQETNKMIRAYAEKEIEIPQRLPEVKGYKFVQMTPSPAPGVDVEASPFVTWGDIEGTPMILDAYEGDREETMTAPMFSIAPESTRDRVASTLGKKAKYNLLKSVHDLSSVARVASKGKRKRALNELTPAARRIASRMSSNGRFSTPLTISSSQKQCTQVGPNLSGVAFSSSTLKTNKDNNSKVKERKIKNSSSSVITDDLLNI